MNFYTTKLSLIIRYLLNKQVFLHPIFKIKFYIPSIIQGVSKNSLLIMVFQTLLIFIRQY